MAYDYIPSEIWSWLVQSLAEINGKAGTEVYRYIRELDWQNSPEDRKKAIDYAYGVCTKYGEAGNALVCEFYDKIKPMEIAEAVPAETATYGEVAKAINGTAKTGNPKLIADSVSRLVKQTTADTVLFNGIRDGAEFAWIPQGDTCPFCLMLASRGWQKISKKVLKNGHAEHIHANCDCMYAVRFNNHTEVKGYDNGKKYREMYDNAKGSTPEAKLNYMRQQHDAEHAEEIKEQKHIAYIERKKREEIGGS